MTSSSTADDETATVALGPAIAGTRGHAVLGSSGDRVAIWHVTPTGHKTGAWVYDHDTRDRARMILTLIERRAIAGTDREEDITLLRKIAKQADVRLPLAYAGEWIDLCTILTEIIKARQALQQRAKEHCANASGFLRPLTYTYQVDAGTLPDDPLRALAELGLAMPQASETVARLALAKADILSAAVARWVDTESARLRRTYLRDEGGPAGRPLPASWLTKLTTVYGAPIDL